MHDWPKKHGVARERRTTPGIVPHRSAGIYQGNYTRRTSEIRLVISPD
jgi:hypothetical protein